MASLRPSTPSGRRQRPSSRLKPVGPTPSSEPSMPQIRSSSLARKRPSLHRRSSVPSRLNLMIPNLRSRASPHRQSTPRPNMKQRRPSNVRVTSSLAGLRSLLRDSQPNEVRRSRSHLVASSRARRHGRPSCTHLLPSSSTPSTPPSTPNTTVPSSSTVTSTPISTSSSNEPSLRLDPPTRPTQIHRLLLLKSTPIPHFASFLFPLTRLLRYSPVALRRFRMLGRLRCEAEEEERIRVAKLVVVLREVWVWNRVLKDRISEFVRMLIKEKNEALKRVINYQNSNNSYKKNSDFGLQKKKEKKEKIRGIDENSCLDSYSSHYLFLSVRKPLHPLILNSSLRRRRRRKLQQQQLASTSTISLGRSPLRRRSNRRSNRRKGNKRGEEEVGAPGILPFGQPKRPLVPNTLIRKAADHDDDTLTTTTMTKMITPRRVRMPTTFTVEFEEERSDVDVGVHSDPSSNSNNNKKMNGDVRRRRKGLRTPKKTTNVRFRRHIPKREETSSLLQSTLIVAPNTDPYAPHLLLLEGFVLRLTSLHDLLKRLSAATFGDFQVAISLLAAMENQLDEIEPTLEIVLRLCGISDFQSSETLTFRRIRLSAMKGPFHRGVVPTASQSQSQSPKCTAEIARGGLGSKRVIPVDEGRERKEEVVEEDEIDASCSTAPLSSSCVLRTKKIPLVSHAKRSSNTTRHRSRSRSQQRRPKRRRPRLLSPSTRLLKCLSTIDSSSSSSSSSSPPPPPTNKTGSSSSSTMISRAKLNLKKRPATHQQQRRRRKKAAFRTQSRRLVPSRVSSRRPWNTSSSSLRRSSLGTQPRRQKRLKRFGMSGTSLRRRSHSVRSSSSCQQHSSLSPEEEMLRMISTERFDGWGDDSSSSCGHGLFGLEVDDDDCLLVPACGFGVPSPSPAVSSSIESNGRRRIEN